MAVKVPPRTHIVEMKVGDVRWTVPWAMTTKDGAYYINGEYHAHAEPGGVIQMKIVRTEEGFSVTLPPSNMHYVGRHFITTGMYFPVVEINQPSEE